MKNTNEKKVAILTADDFEEIELPSPKKAMEAAGFKVEIVSAEKKEMKAWNHDHWSITLPVDVPLSEANPEDYDALMVPGEVRNPDKMSNQKEYVEFAKSFMKAGKQVAAICHGPQLLIEPGLLEGRKIPSYPAIKTDIINAGADW